jgi:hypothetical protein
MATYDSIKLSAFFNECSLTSNPCLIEKKAKPSVSILPRSIWLKYRVDHCIESIKNSSEIENWDEYRRKAADLASELLYAVTEWEKYYEKS